MNLILYQWNLVNTVSKDRRCRKRLFSWRINPVILQFLFRSWFFIFLLTANTPSCLQQDAFHCDPSGAVPQAGWLGCLLVPLLSVALLQHWFSVTNRLPPAPGTANFSWLLKLLKLSIPFPAPKQYYLAIYLPFQWLAAQTEISCTMCMAKKSHFTCVVTILPQGTTSECIFCNSIILKKKIGLFYTFINIRMFLGLSVMSFCTVWI